MLAGTPPLLDGPSPLQHGPTPRLAGLPSLPAGPPPLLPEPTPILAGPPPLSTGTMVGGCLFADEEARSVKPHANIASENNRRRPNPTILKHRKFMMFQTANNSKLLWDSAHLTIQSIPTKSDQVHHFLTGSNIDFL